MELKARDAVAALVLTLVLAGLVVLLVAAAVKP